MDFVAQDWWIGLNQPGGDIKQEIQTETIWGTTLGHGSSQMTDSMAVYNLFFNLDKSLAAMNLNDAMDFLAPIFKAGSAKSNETLESLVNAMGKLLVPGFSKIKNMDNREELYAAIKQVSAKIPESGATLVTMVDKPSANMISNAKGSGNDALAFRYALKELNPFVILGLGYGQFNQNGELDLIDPATGNGTLSDSWIGKRAEMLTWLINGNIGDKCDLSGEMTITDNSIAGDWIFTDVDGKHKINVEHSTSSEIEDEFRNQVHFSSATKSDNFTGGSVSDFIYGGGGNDRICADNYAAITARRCAA